MKKLLFIFPVLAMTLSLSLALPVSATQRYIPESDFKTETPQGIYCVEGYKINDDTNEGIEGWLIYRYNSSGILMAITTTNADGQYKFCTVSGNYQICEDIKAGWINVSPTCINVTISDSDITGINFRNTPICIEGNKINDDTDEGIEGWTISLYNSSGILMTQTTTDVDGGYKFYGVGPGDYQVCEENKAGWTSVSPTCINVTINNSSISGINFRNVLSSPPIISGTTYEASGSILGGVTIAIDGGDSVVSSVNGTYQTVATTTGNSTVMASKAGFRDQTQVIEITDLTIPYNLDFKGNNGLVPNAPNISYVLSCINRWQFPPSDGTGLSLSKVLSVINAWQFPYSPVPVTVSLEDIDSGLTSPSGVYRWLDVAGQAYSDDYRDSYNYTQASVQVTYIQQGTILTGQITASNLKPNFAYQLKLDGNPIDYPEANENIGFVGRWWREQWDGTAWVNGVNSNDADYLEKKDVIDDIGGSPTGLKYKFIGYLLFDYFITDGNGNAIVEWQVDSSYHVLFKTTQRTPTSSDGPVISYTFDPIINGAYDNDYPESTVDIYGQVERTPVGGIYLSTGSYTCGIMITEESFHGIDGVYSGDWAAAMGAEISFEIIE